MRGATDRGHLAIGLGDFNMVPLSLAHRLIEAHAPVKDVWRMLHPDSSLGAAKDAAEKKRGKPMPTAEYNTIENGATCDSALNTWRWDKALRKRLEGGENVEVDASVPDPDAKRLDYIFFGNGRRTDSIPWAVTAVNVGMMGRHSTLRCSLSDHFSVEATLERALPNLTKQVDASAQVSNSLPSSSSSGIQQTLSPEAYDEILEMIRVYTLRERKQRRLRLGHFTLQLLISIGCWIAVWWAPHNYVSFILMLFSSLGLSAGVIDGLIGGLFVSAELRSLKEFEWDIVNARNRAPGQERLVKQVG